MEVLCVWTGTIEKNACRNLFSEIMEITTLFV